MSAWREDSRQLWGTSTRLWGQSLGMTEKEYFCASPAQLMETVSAPPCLKDSPTRFKLLLQRVFVSWDSHFSGIQRTYSLKDNSLRSKLLLCSQSWDWSLICCSLPLTHKQSALHNLQKLFFETYHPFFSCSIIQNCVQFSGWIMTSGKEIQNDATFYSYVF